MDISSTGKKLFSFKIICIVRDKLFLYLSPEPKNVFLLKDFRAVGHSQMSFDLPSQILVAPRIVL